MTFCASDFQFQHVCFYFYRFEHSYIKDQVKQFKKMVMKEKVKSSQKHANHFNVYEFKLMFWKTIRYRQLLNLIALHVWLTSKVNPHLSLSKETHDVIVIKMMKRNGTRVFSKKYRDASDRQDSQISWL